MMKTVFLTLLPLVLTNMDADGPACVDTECSVATASVMQAKLKGGQQLPYNSLVSSLENSPKESANAVSVKLNKVSAGGGLSTAAMLQTGLMGKDIEDAGRVDWMNTFMQVLWPRLRKAVSHVMQTELTQKIKDELQGPVLGLLKESFALDCDLGSTPPKVVSASAHGRGSADNATAARLHFGFEFESEDVNVKVGLLGISVDSNAFVLKSVRVKGVLVGVLDQLMDEFPLAGGIGLHFLDPPDVDYDLTGLLAWADWPGLRKIFRSCTDKLIASHVVMPHQKFIPLGTIEQGLDMVSLAHPPPLGKVKVTVKSAHNLADHDPLPGFWHSDVYVVIMVGSFQWESSVEEGPNPVWSDNNEHAFDFWDPHQSIKIRLWDKDHMQDDRLGHTEDIQIKDIETYSGQPLQVLKEGEEAGTQGTVTLEFSIVENS